VWEGKGVGNCVLRADCVRGIGYSVGREGSGKLRVEGRLC